MKRRICVFTGSRAEYGLLRALLCAIKRDKTLKLQLLVSGMHLSSKFGLTYKEIEKDGFTIDEKVNILLSDDTSEGVSRSMAIGLKEYTKAYLRLNPDIIVVLGDRFEAFAAAVAAMIARIPIAHLSGGEATFGLIDEAIRHSITKMSHLHFTSTEEYRKRVMQLGENPGRVFNVGAMGLDNIKGLKLIPMNALERDLSFKFNKHNLLVTYHPVTLEEGSSGTHFQNLLGALSELKNTNIVFTKTNADPEGGMINRMIDAYRLKNPVNTAAFASLGRLRYLSVMKIADAVVGNSSSGIIEAPSFKIGTINIGDRQKGRIRADSVIDCGTSKKDISNAFKRLYSGRFREKIRRVKNPYEGKGTTKKMISVLKKFKLNDILKKSFYEISA